MGKIVDLHIYMFFRISYSFRRDVIYYVALRHMNGPIWEIEYKFKNTYNQNKSINLWNNWLRYRNELEYRNEILTTMPSQPHCISMTTHLALG